MYKNSGKLLKGIIEAFVKLGMVMCVLAAFIIVIVMSDVDMLQAICIGGLALILGCLLIWLSGLVLTVIADIEINTRNIDEKLQQEDEE